jgi:RNA polymerase sigma factor (sigma-70 family)
MSTYQAYIDSLILNALKEDDDKPLNHLFEFYYNRLYRAGLRWCADGSLTEECIQDVFLDLWLYRQSLGTILSLENYLKISLRRRIFKKLKQIDPLSNSANFDFEMTPSILSTESYETILIQQQTDDLSKQRLLNALETLTQKQRDIIHLKYFETLSYKDIADKTGVEIGTLYKLLHDAVKKLKIILENK